MLWPKTNSYKEFDNKKKFLLLENSPPPPPITFLMVRPLPLSTSATQTNFIRVGSLRGAGYYFFYRFIPSP